jgi:hypothetical protein
MGIDKYLLIIGYNLLINNKICALFGQMRFYVGPGCYKRLLELTLSPSQLFEIHLAMLFDPWLLTFSGIVEWNLIAP